MVELAVVRYINHLGQGTILDNISLWISDIRFIIAIWLLVGVLAFILDKKHGKAVLLGLILVTAIYFLVNDVILKQGILKFLLPIRPRPFIAYPEIIPIGQKFYDSSFPSGHMGNTAAILVIFVAYYRKALLPAIGVLLIMTLSRLHNGMHYPSDLLGGAILGVLYGLLGLWIVRKIAKRI